MFANAWSDVERRGATWSDVETELVQPVGTLLSRLAVSDGAMARWRDGAMARMARWREWRDGSRLCLAERPSSPLDPPLSDYEPLLSA